MSSGREKYHQRIRFSQQLYLQQYSKGQVLQAPTFEPKQLRLVLVLAMVLLLLALVLVLALALVLGQRAMVIRLLIAMQLVLWWGQPMLRSIRRGTLSSPRERNGKLKKDPANNLSRK